MTEQFDFFLSNRLEILYQYLKKNLFSDVQYPLTRRLIVVYGPAMKNWLMLRMAQDEELGVAIGVQFIYLNQAFEELVQCFCRRSYTHLPGQLELALAIEKEITSVFQNFSSLHEYEQKSWLPLIYYLKLDPHSLSSWHHVSRKTERRLIALSQQLAQQFRDYGRYAYELVQTWENQFCSGWQQQLWQRLFQSKTGWSYPAREFEQTIVSALHHEVHFFSISFITDAEFRFLKKLGDSLPVRYYLLSPCAVFWSDIRSDKEAAYLNEQWRRRIGKEAPQLAKLDELLRDRNPLLANFGRLGREMAYHLEEHLAQHQASYVLPSHVEEEEAESLMNDDLILTPTDKPLTLLHAVQADILLMRNPQDFPAFSIDQADASIQLHVAPTRQREAQILYHTLMKLIQEEDGALCPNDIIVMAPQIADYTSYIESVFGSLQSQLDFQVLDLGMHAHNEIVQGFLQLIDLSESRWDVTHLLQLFGHRDFQRRHRIAQTDYYIIQEWIEKAGIRWGDDLQHRNELLERRHCQKGMADGTAVGTWDYGLTRLLLGLTTILKSSSSLLMNTLPCDDIDFSQGDLLGRWIRLLHSLRDDLTPLHDRTKMSMNDWADYLNCLLENYFEPDFNQAQSVEDYEELKAHFEILRVSSKSFQEAVFSFESVKTHLKSLLNQRGMTYRENYLQTVRFCSMTPLRSIPAKVIYLMGMQEGSFPRTAQASSLNLMAGQETIDYCPTAADLDRYLFLEALHSAQDYLIISYQGYNYAENKEQQPSLIIEELFSYLDKSYRIQGEKASLWCIFRHSFDSFDARYFQQERGFANYSLQDYQASQIYYKTAKEAPHRFVQEFVLTDEPNQAQAPEKTIIDIYQLMAVARNPIKFHLNHGLDIYLQKEENRQVKNDEEFNLSFLTSYLLKQSAIKRPLKEVIDQADKEGKMPFGLFKSVASRHLADEVDELREHLKKHQLTSQDLFQIEFCPSCSEPTRIESDHWLFPAVSIPYATGQTVQIIGKIPYATTKGLVVMSKGTLADTWKAWPQFLLYDYATVLHPDEMERQLIPLHAKSPKKAFFDDPLPLIRRFLDYYQLCLTTFSPLLPDWICFILEGDAKGLQDKIEQTFSPSFGDYQNDDLRWILHKDHLPSSEAIIEGWKKKAETLVGELLKNWHPTKQSTTPGDL